MHKRLKTVFLFLYLTCVYSFTNEVDDAFPQYDVSATNPNWNVQTNKEKLTLEKMECKIKSLEASLARLTEQVKSLESPSPSSVIVDSLSIGRWRLEVSPSDEALILRDTESDGDKRYAFPVGGRSDMYKDGVGGDIFATRVVFPIRWSIGEESGSYLVFRDRGAAGVDRRYAMAASRYRDL